MPDPDGREERHGLGDLDEILAHACRQNNKFLDRLYHTGLRQREVALDDRAMEDYLKSLPTGSMDILMRLKEGGPLGELVEKGLASSGLLRAMLLELRRRGAVRPTSVSTMIPMSSPARGPNATPSAAASPASDSGAAPPVYPRHLVPLLALSLMVSVFAITFLLLTR